MSQSDTIRSDFKQRISKLNEIDTRAQAFKEIQTLITQNKTTNNLRIWLSVLSQNRKRHTQSQIYVIGFIVKVYGKSLLDPIDKVPSLEKSVFRITEIISRFFGQQLQNVANACQKTWIDIYQVTLKDEPLQIKKKLLYDNLQAIINGGGGKVAQTTAQFIVDGLLQRSLSAEDLPFFKQIAKRVLVLFLKTTVIHPATLTSLQTILVFFNINNLIPLLQQIVGKVLNYIPLAQPNSTGYKIKGQICNTLAVIGDQIDRNGLEVYDKVIKVLNDMATDKVWAVQAPGRKALQIWNSKKKQWDEQFLAKNERIAEKVTYMPDKESPLSNLKQNVSQYPKTTDNWMKAKEQPEQAISPMQLRKNETAYEAGGWANNKSKRQPRNMPQQDQTYLQKNTGQGGGNNYLSAEQNIQRQKFEQTHQHKMQEIKKSIYGAKSQIQFEDTVVLDEDKGKGKGKKQGQQKLQQQRSNIPEKVEDGGEDEEDDFLGQWEKVLELAQKDKFQESVKLLLEMDDDLYFLRYFLKYSSNLLQKLTRPTSTKALKKILSIKKTNFMQQMLFKMVAESSKYGIGMMLTNSQNLQIRNYLDNAGKISGLKEIAEKLGDKYQSSIS